MSPVIKKYLFLVSIGLNIFLASWILFRHRRAVINGERDTSKDSLVTYTFNKFKAFEERKKFFEIDPVKANDIVFAGNSLIANFPLADMAGHIKNRGITGENTYDLLARVNDIALAKPAKLFVMEGINDIGQHIPEDKFIENLMQFVDQVKKKSPGTEIYIYSILPVTDINVVTKVRQYNKSLQKLCSIKHINYINLFPAFFNGIAIKPDLTLDGIHLTAKGYATWYNTLDQVLAK